MALCVSGAARAEVCSSEQFAAAVDKSGAALRAFNAEALPTLRAKLKELKDKRGWDDAGFEEKGLATVRDQHSEKLDADAEDLILKIDTLGRPPADKPAECARLAELDAAGLELLAVMKAKSAYTFSKLDAAIGEGGASTALSPKDGAGPTAKPNEKETRPSQQQAAAAPPKPIRKSEAKKWSTQTKAESLPEPPVATLEPQPEAPVANLAPLPPGVEGGYSIDEIREISRGFFGTISANLGSVLEYAFSTSGRPTGYVLGTEGGGAFLAGVRYGSGDLYMRSGATEKVYWHGPSIGTDIGASGSRTMFLIYSLREPAGIFRNFTGIDGSAYIVGGIGITYLQGGDVTMAPIRSGLGLRIGANLGYIRFTPRQTWNPF